jgi:glycosyltransferase involved in cell wall biosynthesis
VSARSEADGDGPLVTALVPVREFEPRYLTAAIKSLVNQTDPVWKAIVVVEHDRRAAVEATIGDGLRDARITLAVNEGAGLAAAFNTGMVRATTPFVAELLGDDLWTPNAVAVLTGAIRARPDVDFFHTGRRIIDGDDDPISEEYLARSEVSLEDFAMTAPVKHLLCWRRELGLAAGGMDESIRFHGPDDFDFPWTLAEHGAVFGAIPECVYLYRDHRSHPRLTIDVPRSVQLAELRRIFDKHGVPPSVTRTRLRAAKRSYLRQCRYRSELHRRVARRLRITPSGRHESYR